MLIFSIHIFITQKYFFGLLSCSFFPFPLLKWLTFILPFRKYNFLHLTFLTFPVATFYFMSVGHLGIHSLSVVLNVTVNIIIFCVCVNFYNIVCKACVLCHNNLVEYFSYFSLLSRGFNIYTYFHPQ